MAAWVLQAPLPKVAQYPSKTQLSLCVRHIKLSASLLSFLNAVHMCLGPQAQWQPTWHALTCCLACDKLVVTPPNQLKFELNIGR